MPVLRTASAWLAATLVAACATAPAARSTTPAGFLEAMTWQEAERALTADTVVVIPLGAAAKEHGPHLPLANDWNMADDLRRRLAARTPVVTAPIVGLSFYPAFAEYPGSIGLSLETSRDVIVELVRSVARHGPRRFYVLNTGVSTIRALRPAAEKLAAEGILLGFTDLIRTLEPIENRISQQEGGTHADEIETSIMLYIAPDTVDMSRAVKDYRPGTGPLTRDPERPGVYSPTGSWGDPTLATRAKGEQIVQALVDALVADVEAVRKAPLPVPRPVPTAPGAPAPPAAP